MPKVTGTLPPDAPPPENPSRLTSRTGLSQGESIGRRRYAVGRGPARPLSSAVHAALALAALKPWFQARPRPPLTAHPGAPTPLAARVSSSALGPPPRPRRGSNCRSQRGGAGLPVGPHAPPVALKLENQAPAEGAERPLQDSGAPAGPVGRQPAAPPARAHLQRGPRAPLGGSHIRGPRRRRRLNPPLAGGTPQRPRRLPGERTRPATPTVRAAGSLPLAPPHPASESASTGRGHRRRRPAALT